MIYNKISGFSDEIDSDIDIQFAVLNKLGIKYYEPRFINGKNISELCDKEVYSLKEKMDNAGISASSIGSPIGKVKLNDDFEKHFELYKRVCRTAKILQCQYIRIFSFYHDSDVWTEDERVLVLERLSKMIAYAKEENLILYQFILSWRITCIKLVILTLLFYKLVVCTSFYYSSLL